MESIILMTETLKSFDAMSDADAGAILKALLRHAIGQEENLSDSPVVQAVYPLIEQQVDRMSAIREKRAAAGRIGGEVCLKQNEANVSKTKQTEANGEQTETNPAPIPIPIPNKEKGILTDTERESADPEVQRAFQEFNAMRTKIKKPLTDAAKKRAWMKLKTLAGEDPKLAVQILNQSTDHCWQDLYALKPPDNVIKKPNSFFDFDQRNDDLDAIIRKEM